MIALLLAPDLKDLEIVGLLKMSRYVREQGRELAELRERVDETGAGLAAKQSYPPDLGAAAEAVQEKQQRVLSSPAEDPGAEAFKAMIGRAAQAVATQVMRETQGAERRAIDPESDDGDALFADLAWLWKNISQYETSARIHRLSGDRMAHLDEERQQAVDRWARASPATTPIFQVDPDLLAGVSPRASSELADTRVGSMAVSTGPWLPPSASEAFAFLVISGALARETRVPGERSLELVGPGDVVLTAVDEPLGSVPSVAQWEAIQPSEVALLDERFAAQAARAPRILVQLARRASERADRNLIQMTIAGAHPVQRRIELLLWHLADRWGVRREGGVDLPVRLTQRTLAALTATERSTVCRVLIELVDNGTLERLPEKHLRLRGAPPSQELIELAEERLSLERDV